MTAKALSVVQRTPEWYAARQHGIGSSDAPIIAGVSPWGDIRTLFAEKIGWAAPAVESETMELGIAFEDPIAKVWAERKGKRIRRSRRMLQHPQLPWMLASLDRVVIGERALLEVKKRRFADEQWGRKDTDEVPDDVRIQVLHAMAVTGYPVTHIAVLFGGVEIRPYIVRRDDDLLAQLIELEQAFWGAVQARELPPDLAELGPKPVPLREGEEPASERLTVLAAQLRGAREAYAQAEERKSDLEDAIRAELADVGAARGEGFRVTYRRNRDGTKVGWQQIAAAYEQRLLQLGADSAELAGLRDLYTVTRPGDRPLRITFTKETADVPL